MILAHQTYGNLNQTPLVMLHGFLCGGMFFKPNIEVLATSFPIITVDLPGFGDSHYHSSEDSIEKMAESVITTLRQLKISRYNLLGHSMGGMVALQMALLDGNSIEKLIAYATHANGNLSERFESFDQSKQRVLNDFEETRRKIASTWFVDGDQHPDFAIVEQCYQNVVQQTALNALTAMENFDISEQISSLKMPTLIIAAECDKTYTSKSINALRKCLPKAQFQLIKSVAHNGHLEDKKKFNRIVRNFIAGD